MKSLVRIINECGFVFGSGVIDSLSFHKTLKFLVNSNEIATDVVQCILANGVLLLGSVFLFHKGLAPVTKLLRQELVNEVDHTEIPGIASLTELSVWSFYHVLWVFPVWVLCYVCSYSWYQSIAHNCYRLQNGSAKEIQAQRALVTGVYATLVWGCAYLQTLLFDKLLPFMLSHLARMATFLATSSHLPLGRELFETLVEFTVAFPLHVLSVASRAIGLILMSIIYGWYGFDMIWTADGKEPYTRYSRVEKHWLYFLGFGCPYVILFKSSSFFVGYGIYLLLFPFTIMLSSLSNQREAYKVDVILGHSVGESGPTGPLRVFRMSRICVDYVIKIVNQRFMKGMRVRKHE